MNGNALIRLRGLKGEYSPDGMAVIPFRARAQGNALWFSARLYGRPMSLCLTRSGETARLVGTQEYEPNRVPVVISPGSQKDREAEAEQRRAETRQMLLPVDLGTFARSPARCLVGMICPLFETSPYLRGTFGTASGSMD